MILKFCHFPTALLFCFHSLVSLAQDEYVIRNFSVEDGLPHSRIVVLHEDSKGYLWIGAYGGGIARFDGQKFESFDESDGLISSVIMGVQVDSKDRVWICTPLGLSRFDGNQFTNFKGEYERGFFGIDIYEHWDTVYTLVSLRNQDMRFGVIYGDSIIRTNHTFGQRERITNIHARDNQNLYLALSNGDLVWLGKDQRRTVAKGLNVIHFFDSKFGLHALTPDGIYDISPSNVTMRYPNVKADWITIDRNFEFAWVWQKSEFKKIAFEGSETVEKEVALPFTPAYSLVDSEGNSWFGTTSQGLFRVSAKDFKKLNNDRVSAFAFAEDKQKNVWVGTRDGIKIFDAHLREKTLVDLGDGQRNRVMSMVADSTGHIWVGTLNGVAQMSVYGRVLKWLTTETGLLANSIRTLELDSKGRLWIAYVDTKPISIYSSERFSVLSESDGLESESVWDLKWSSAQEQMFICTSLGVQMYSDGSFESLKIPEFEDKILVSLGFAGEERLLIGSGGSGLGIYDLTTSKYSLLTTQEGLSSDFIYFAEADWLGRIWVGSVKGIDQVSFNDQYQVQRIVHYGSQNGLSPNGVHSNAVHITDKTILFGLTEGAFLFLPKPEPKLIEFPLHFSRIRVSGRVITSGYDSTYSYRENQFGFSFKKVDKSGVMPRYQYRLDGWDSDWINSSGEAEVLYANLVPNPYRFMVRTAGREGTWNDEIIYSFEILPPFYATFWFKVTVVLLALLLVATAIYARIRYKVNQAIAMERAKNEESARLRKEIGRDFHDEMGNQLARIINYIGLLKMNATGKDQILDKAEQSSKYLLTGTKDFLWSIDPVNDNIDSLLVNIRDFGDKLLNEKRIEFRVFNSIHQPISLPFGFPRQINLIFKEALTNIFKHSMASSVELHFQENDRRIKITLRDNGIGMNGAVPGGGLDNMKSRASRIGALLSIESGTTGTEIELDFSLN